MFKLLLSLVHKKREKIIFILFVLLGIMSTLIFISLVLILIPILISGEGGIALWLLLKLIQLLGKHGSVGGW